MAESKKSNKLLAPVLVATMLAILALVGIVLFSKKQPKQANIAKEPVTLTEEKVEEEIKDGVYTNYTYGFRFEYPSILFDSYNNTVWEKDQGIVFSQSGKVLPQLKVYVSGDYYYRKEYELCLNAEPGQIMSERPKVGTEVKLYDIESNSVCVLRGDPRGLIIDEPVWWYTAYFPINDQTVVMNLSSWQETEINNFRKNFDNVVESFVFTDINN